MWTVDKWRQAVSPRPTVLFSADEGVDVGADHETMVSNDYQPGKKKFTGKIVSVTIDVKPSNLSATDKKSVEDAREAAETIED